MLVNVRSSAKSVERLGTKRGIARKRMLPRVQMLNPFGLVMIVVRKVIRGTDAQRRLSKRKLEARGRAYAIKDAEPQVNHLFEIDLMPIELGTFDIIIGMDWLVKHDAVIICGEKVVHIPYGNKTLTVESDKGMSRLKVISCIKACKYIKRGCHLFLAHVTEKKPKEKRLEDVPVICDFLEVFPDELPGLPPPRQVEFRIDLVPRAAPVARASYRLTLSEMKELSVQLQELLEKGSIRPSSSPWGAPVIIAFLR
ncbi:putative reverse transcriptase domain-containing protein, partial [Tanacetum coccineum]